MPCTVNPKHGWNSKCKCQKCQREIAISVYIFWHWIRRKCLIFLPLLVKICVVCYWELSSLRIKGSLDKMPHMPVTYTLRTCRISSLEIISYTVRNFPSTQEKNCNMFLHGWTQHVTVKQKFTNYSMSYKALVTFL